mmetsp:Transcript_31248/g.64330  ORF Transcript_31248/g.64330 Transcript_31248/m.64330 type:complete len:403 (+) Transcript_31248:37-1245(+)
MITIFRRRTTSILLLTIHFPRSTTSLLSQIPPPIHPQCPSAKTPTTTAAMSSTPSSPSSKEYYRHDGVRITHDPYSPGMAEKYGTPGNTDDEGFDPYKDSVGPGIYGGIVRRDPKTGSVIIGRQYQNHNPRPGPVYAGGGYAPSVSSLGDVEGKLIPLLDKYPDLVNDITTGGAQPLHMCGMSKGKQMAVRALVERGADIEALDTYGMTPLHRMASNNLADGAKALLDAGADVLNEGKIGETPMSIAEGSAAKAVIVVLKEAEQNMKSGKSIPSKKNIVKINVMGSNVTPEVNGDYLPRDPSREIPTGFRKVCKFQGYNTEQMWEILNGTDPDKNTWYAHTENESYIYWNKGDGKWWIDGPDGMGVWIVEGPWHAPLAHGWVDVMRGQVDTTPMVRTYRKIA